MPEETHYEVKDAYHNMEKESEDDKQDYQTDDGPYPWTDLREIDHFSLCRAIVPHIYRIDLSPLNYLFHEICSITIAKVTIIRHG